MPPSRRRVLHTTAGGLPVGLAGCMGLFAPRDEPGASPSSSPTETPPSTPTPTATPTPWGTDLPALAPTWTASPFSGPAGDLLFHDGTLYVMAAGPFAYALDADTGDVEWETDLTDSYVRPARGTAYPGWLDRYGETLFVTTDTDATTEQYVHALDIGKGEKRWTFGAREFLSVPGVVDDVAYLSGNYIRIAPGASQDDAGEGRIRGLSLADGTVQWERTVPNLVESRRNLVVGTLVESGTVVADHGIYAADGRILRAFSLSGDERWSVRGASESVPSIAGSSILFEGADQRTLAAHAAETGDREWTVPFMNHWQVVVTPERIYADSRDIVALTYDGAELWRNRRGGVRLREFLLSSNPLYVERMNAVAALSPTDGTERWSFDPADEKFVYAAGVVDAGLVVYSTGRSDEYVLLDADTGDPRARIPTGYEYPKVDSRGDRLYVGSEGRVLAFDVGTVA